MKAQSVGLRAVIGFGVFMFLPPASLFIAAGRVDWVMGWVNTGLFVASIVGSRLIALRKNPDLLAERARTFQQGREGAKEWDQLLVGLVGLGGPLATWIVAGLDDRFGWSPEVPLAFQLIALAAVVLGYVCAIWAMSANKFFSAVVRIQKERGHTVVSDGPYRFVRHPGYTGGALSYLAAPVMLSSLWALIPAALTVSALVLRTMLEDRTLCAELPGYVEYARRVRYRLLPGVW